jgi:serpin B
LPNCKTAGDAPVPQLLFVVAVLLIMARVTSGASYDAAAKSTNEFGSDLHRTISTGEGNLCLSPYSVSCALAMTLAGADGETRTEMARVLHVDLSSDIDPSFAALQKSLEEMAAKTEKIAQDAKKRGGPSHPITIAIANRLFAQAGYEFRPAFFARVKDYYGAPPELLDFKTNAAAATKRINDWVAQQTHDRIRDLIPQPLDVLTRLVLTNAIYLKAPWANEFNANATKPEPFHVRGKATVDVATMQQRAHFRYAKREGFTAVAIPYSGGDLQFLILLPDKLDGVQAIEKNLSATVLGDCAKMKDSDVFLHLPKFKFEPPTIQLSEQLQALGMKTAFDVPQGSANFDRMAPRKPNSYLAISDVFHKTFIAVDEKGTEAAAATAVVMMELSARREMAEPIEVKVDRPFVYAIQHVPSGACLFIGRVTDPR